MRDSPKCSDTVHPDLGQPFDAIIVWRGSPYCVIYSYVLVHALLYITVYCLVTLSRAAFIYPLGTL